MISSKSILQMECERHDGRSMNESAVPSNPSRMADRMQSLLPPPLSIGACTVSYDSHTHRSINHLSKEMPESSSLLSSSFNTDELLRNGSLLLTSHATVPPPPQSNVGNVLQHHHESLRTNRVKYYVYLYVRYFNDRINSVYQRNDSWN
jgi:hypothetical protein